MNCKETHHYMDDYLDTNLPQPLRHDMEKHIDECSSCKEALESSKTILAALRSLPYQMPSQDQINQNIQKAVEKGRQQERRQTMWQMTAMAAMVCLLLSFTLTNSFFKGGTEKEQAALTISLYEQKTVSLLVDARQAMENAQITIELPAQLSLAGFPGQRTISWHTDLKSGKNILKLPIIADGQGRGTISTRIEHDNQNKTMHIETYISGPA